MRCLGYQTEIDNITKRTKYAENAFLTVYKLLADAPDPAPLFEAAVVCLQANNALDHIKINLVHIGPKCSNGR